mmetsp:Transcript_49558/g.146419  ORF Transcript_49558/g.146419 Transcript_49558/m.146419 type:complete len:367 (-) Transcript_49558:587-1687(-)
MLDPARGPAVAPPLAAAGEAARPLAEVAGAVGHAEAAVAALLDAGRRFANVVEVVLQLPGRAVVAPEPLPLRELLALLEPDAPVVRGAGPEGDEAAVVVALDPPGPDSDAPGLARQRVVAPPRVHHASLLRGSRRVQALVPVQEVARGGVVRPGLRRVHPVARPEVQRAAAVEAEAMAVLNVARLPVVEPLQLLPEIRARPHRRLSAGRPQVGLQAEAEAVLHLPDPDTDGPLLAGLVGRLRARLQLNAAALLRVHGRQAHAGPVGRPPVGERPVDVRPLLGLGVLAARNDEGAPVGEEAVPVAGPEGRRLRVVAPGVLLRREAVLQPRPERLGVALARGVLQAEAAATPDLPHHLDRALPQLPLD